MLSRIDRPTTMGAIVQRVRKDRNLSRAALASQSGVGARTIYALEMGEGDNIGLSNLMRILKALGLSLYADASNPAPDHSDFPIDESSKHPNSPLPWSDLSDPWRLPE